MDRGSVRLNAKEALSEHGFVCWYTLETSARTMRTSRCSVIDYYTRLKHGVGTNLDQTLIWWIFTLA